MLAKIILGKKKPKLNSRKTVGQLKWNGFIAGIQSIYKGVPEHGTHYCSCGFTMLGIDLTKVCIISYPQEYHYPQTLTLTISCTEHVGQVHHIGALNLFVKLHCFSKIQRSQFRSVLCTPVN